MDRNGPDHQNNPEQEAVSGFFCHEPASQTQRNKQGDHDGEGSADPPPEGAQALMPSEKLRDTGLDRPSEGIVLSLKHGAPFYRWLLVSNLAK